MPEILKVGDGSVIGSILLALEETKGEGWMSMASSLVKSSQKIQQYRWLGMAPAVREWIGGRQPQGLRADAFPLENLKFESTLEVEVDDLNRDNFGQIRQRIADLAGRVVGHWDLLGSAALALGESQLCYDGQPFFSANHVEGKSGTQVNLLTENEVPELLVGDAAAPTALEMANAVLACISWQYFFKDDQGELLNGSAKRFLLMVPVPLFVPAVAAVSVDNFPIGGVLFDNPLVQLKDSVSVSMVVNPSLDWVSSFALLRLDASSKPLIRQEEYDVKISKKGEGSDFAHDMDRHEYGLKFSRNVGYAFWQFIEKATFSQA